MSEPSKLTVTAPIIIEVTAPPAAPPRGVTPREADGGMVLDVGRETRALLIEFGWLPPVDGA